MTPTGHARVSVEAAVLADNVERTIRGAGNGPIDAFADGLNKAGFPFLITSYSEHALSIGSDSKAAAYVRVECPDGVTAWGVGMDTSIHLASFKAILCALNRAAAREATTQDVPA